MAERYDYIVVGSGFGGSRGRPAAGREGLPRPRRGDGKAVEPGGFPQDKLAAPQGLLDVGPPVLRHPAPHALARRARASRDGRGRRQPGLRQHPHDPQPPGLPRSQVERPERLGADPRAALRNGPADARGHRQPPPDPGRRGPAGDRRGDGMRQDLSSHGRGGLLRRGGKGGAGPVLRRGGARAHGLQLLRRVHGGLPLQRQEHPRQELPLLRRKARRENPPRNSRAVH